MKLEKMEEPREMKKKAQNKAKENEKFLDRDAIIALYTASSYCIPKYLWREWSSELKQNGVFWQLFLRAISACKREIVDWAEEKISWEELLKIIKNKLEALR